MALIGNDKTRMLTVKRNKKDLIKDIASLDTFGEYQNDAITFN